MWHMRRKTELKPNTQIHLIVNGFAVWCRVRDIRTQAGLDCVMEINRRLARGERMTGFGSRFGDHNVQINWA
jgi:hypothetical protein